MTKKFFAKGPLGCHPETCNDKPYIPNESVDTASVNS